MIVRRYRDKMHCYKRLSLSFATILPCVLCFSYPLGTEEEREIEEAEREGGADAAQAVRDRIRTEHMDTELLLHRKKSGKPITLNQLGRVKTQNTKAVNMEPNVIYTADGTMVGYWSSKRSSSSADEIRRMLGLDSNGQITLSGIKRNLAAAIGGEKEWSSSDIGELFTICDKSDGCQFVSNTILYETALPWTCPDVFTFRYESVKRGALVVVNCDIAGGVSHPFNMGKPRYVSAKKLADSGVSIMGPNRKQIRIKSLRTAVKNAIPCKGTSSYVDGSRRKVYILAEDVGEGQLLVPTFEACILHKGGINSPL